MGIPIEADIKPFSRGSTIYDAGTEGKAWRIVSGTVRLDHPGSTYERGEFASLAISGDVIGAETLIYGHYAYCAVALSPVIVIPWPEGKRAPASNVLLQLLAATEKRAAELLAIRVGEALDRVTRLIGLLRRNEVSPGEEPRVLLPGLRDMADITGLSMETVSRILSRLKREGKLRAGVKKEFPLPGRYFGLSG